MKKALFTTLAFMAAIFTVQTATAAKPIEFGVRAGVQTRNLGNFTEIVNSGSFSGLSADNSLGFQAAFMSRINFLGMFVQPEIAYSFNKYELKLNNIENTKITLHDFEVPVLVGTRIAFAQVFAGPVFNLGSNVKSSDAGIVSDIVKAAAGYQVGVGVRLWDLNLDLRYGGDFSKAKQTITEGVNTGTAKTSDNGWIFNVGYFF